MRSSAPAWRGIQFVVLACALTLAWPSDLAAQVIWSDRKPADSLSKQRAALLAKIEDLPGDAPLRPPTVGTLVGIWRHGTDQVAEDALRILLQRPHPMAKGVYLAELRNNTHGRAAAAARALGAVQARKAIPKMLEVYEDADNNLRIALLDSFTQMPDARTADIATKTLGLSVDTHPIALHAYACDLLGNLAQTTPQALDEMARRRLVRGMYLANEKGQNTADACGLAVQKLGQPAVPILLETLRGENTAVQKLMERYSRDPSPQFPPNRPKVRAVQSLVSLRAEAAVDPFIEKLKAGTTLPEKLEPRRQNAWVRFEAQILDEMLVGLGKLGAGQAEDLLVDVLEGGANERWKAVLDPLVELQLRQDAARALMSLGVRSARPALLETARKGVVSGLEKRAEALAQMDNGRAMSPLQRYQLNWMSARAYAFLANADNRADFEQMITERKSSELKEKMRSFLPAFDVADACLTEKAPEAKAACLAGRLDDQKLISRQKAAWELTRLPAEVAAPVLIEYLQTDHLDLREILIFGLYRVGPTEPAEAIQAIDKILERERPSDMRNQHKLQRHQLKLLRAWLKNQKTR